MNKKKIVAIALILISLSVTIVVCNWKNISKKVADIKGPGRLVGIDIEVAALNKSKIVHIDYPSYTYELNYGDASTGEHGGLIRKEIERRIQNKEIPAKTIKRLNALVESMQQDSTSESNQSIFDSNNYTYRVEVHTSKKKFSSNVISATGYNALPECWPEFVQIINDILETEALDANPELLGFSNEWYKEAFAIDDSDFEYGNFDDMVKDQELGMADIIGDKYWTPMRPIGEYQKEFTALNWDEIDKCVAREIQVVDSTEEEFVKFVENYFDAISDPDYTIQYHYMETDEGIKYGVSCNSVESIMIYRSCIWQPEQNSDGTYAYIDRNGPEGMIYCWPAYYSPDGKYILVIGSNQEKYFKAFGLLSK